MDLRREAFARGDVVWCILGLSSFILVDDSLLFPLRVPFLFGYFFLNSVVPMLRSCASERESHSVLWRGW